MSTQDGAAAAGRRDAAGAAPGYVERLWPAWWLYLVVTGLGIGFGLVVAPFGATVSVVVAVVMTLVLAALLLATATAVGVRGDRFVAGRANIPVTFLGGAEALDATGMRQAHGPELDARAYLCLRGWIGAGVRVAVTDPADPAPYWLVSTRHPDRVVAALERARRA
jgi:hypothetical protein